MILYLIVFEVVLLKGDQTLGWSSSRSERWKIGDGEAGLRARLRWDEARRCSLLSLQSASRKVGDAFCPNLILCGQ